MSAERPRQGHVGRAAIDSPANRFEKIHCEGDFDQLDAAEMDPPRRVPTEFLPDNTGSVICENNSPDLGFRFSINPYRGCEHGCAYCYARPGHEFLGMNAGIDFESKILVKFDAARRLREELNQRRWKGDVIAISGVTDCYQPAERKFRVTRSLLEVMLEARQPLGIVTKNALVLRDLDLLMPLAERNLAHVSISITTLDAPLARMMEPRTATPAARLRAIGELSAAGVPVRVMAAPIIPGLNDHEIPAILAAARDAGAGSASSILLRLPQSVLPVFRSWLETNLPLAAARVLSRIRQTRSGKLNDSRFGRRMRGEGCYADGIRQSFDIMRRKHGLDKPLPPPRYHAVSSPSPAHRANAFVLDVDRTAVSPPTCGHCPPHASRCDEQCPTAL